MTRGLPKGVEFLLAMMRPLKPSRRDLEECKSTITTFEYGSGSFNSLGEFQPDHGLPFALYMFLPVTTEQLESLWVDNVGVFDTTHDMLLAAQSLQLYLRYFKVKSGLFRSRWVGNVKVVFGPKSFSSIGEQGSVDVGSVAGSTQAAMWDHFRRALAGNQMLLHGTPE